MNHVNHENWYKISQSLEDNKPWPRWFQEEVAKESEHISMAIYSAQSSPDKEFEGVSLDELQKARDLILQDPVKYFNNETYRHNRMAIGLQIRNIEGWEQHEQLGKIYGDILRKIENWQRNQRNQINQKKKGIV